MTNSTESSHAELVWQVIGKIMHDTQWVDTLSKEERLGNHLLRDRAGWFTQNYLLPRANAITDLATGEQEAVRRCLAICHKWRCLPPADLQRAAQELSQIAPAGEEYATAVTGLLQHQSLVVKISACQALGRIGGRTAKATLESVLRNPDSRLRGAAEESLQFLCLKDLAHEMRRFCLAGEISDSRPCYEQLKAKLKHLEGSLPAEAGVGGIFESARQRAEMRDEDDHANVQAFERDAEHLLHQYPGESLAFCNGGFQMHDRDQQRIALEMATLFPGRRVLIVEPLEGIEGDE